MENKPSKSPKPNPDWERLKQVIKHSGMSIHAFALHIGLPRSENLYQIKKGNHGISKALAQTIHDYYPDFSIGWLLSGVSEASITSHSTTFQVGDSIIRNVPIYYQQLRNTKPMHHIYISEDYINGAEMVIINKDESLSPKIPVGAMVFVKQTENIISGQLYLIATKGFSIIRKLTARDEQIYLSSIDRDNYADFLLNRSEIVGLYSVEKILSD